MHLFTFPLSMPPLTMQKKETGLRPVEAGGHPWYGLRAAAGVGGVAGAGGDSREEWECEVLGFEEVQR